MKILHTSDWHLGKTLEKYSRIDEQKKFIEELNKIVIENNVDLIVVSGDIYDTSNPTIEAEQLFFKALKMLCLDGKRPIVIISGNHDSCERLISSYPLSIEFGIILIGSVKTIVNKGKYNHFEIFESGEGFFEIHLNNEKAVFLNIPYVTEKNLNEVIFNKETEFEQQESYSEKIKSIFERLSSNFKEDSINIVTGHFFVKGGKETESERKVQSIGGVYSVSSDIFPKRTQYAALGHLHRPQKVKTEICKAYYSGSPIQYSKSEIGYPKSVFIVDVKSNEESVVKEVNLTNYKPIEVWKCETYEEALNKCIENKDKSCWVYLEIKISSPLTAFDIKKLREEKEDIVEIKVKFEEESESYVFLEDDISIESQFKEFYLKKKNVYPSEQVLKLFLDTIEEVEEDETNIS